MTEFIDTGDVTIAYEEFGGGPTVVLVMGAGSPGRVWRPYQVPALVDAGFRVVTYDHRGVGGSSECPEGFTLADLTDDLATLVEKTTDGHAHIVGTSIGARAAQRLALTRPELVDRLALLATRGRGDAALTAYAHAQMAVHDQDVAVPTELWVALNALAGLSPASLRDDARAQDWLDMLGMVPATPSAGVRQQFAAALTDFPHDITEFGRISARTLVVSFTDDRLSPPHLGVEVARAIPDARHELVAETGHFGYLERPEEVNRLLVDFLTG
ncbi:alpha/beta fold hydrolase [Streptomyces chumphonensis]|uniref:Alpha/beta fold hydrolase n=1 Tax=Streptomyces chumphonensis TaxID=1214925 RepID=A0A927F2I6_9ACTN|nr:alpha/beta hydrolase [Streptomyces chumphonensis]MBD3933126.1 alpha/beta fold hydrolase [Streptomyces chumphonensis]